MKPNAPRKGESNPNSKLTEWQVEELRKFYRSGNFSMSTIARTFSISKTQVCRIIHLKNWKQAC